MTPNKYTIATAVAFENMVGAARKYAAAKHDGQTYQEFPYVTHLAEVAIPFYIMATVAWLHDILEDTETTAEELAEVFGEQITALVGILTRREGEAYFAYIRRVKQDRIATMIKLVDVTANLEQAEQDEKYSSLAARYRKARNILEGFEE